MGDIEFRFGIVVDAPTIRYLFIMIPKSTIRIIVPVAIAIGAFIAIYYIFDPANNLFPKCLFYQLTGWECAGCGSQRMVHALLHGDFVAAWHYNPAILILSPVFVLMLIASFYRNRLPRFYNIVYSPWVVWSVLGSILAWWIGRNIF